jgi:broad specificity phosphatase PhoE
MSSLALVRHGQASFFADDYDVLSPLGEAQARHLGDHWARRGEVFDEVYVGPRRRQQRTAELAGEQVRRAGQPWPAPVVVPELDEYDLAGLLQRLAPDLARRDRAFAGLVDAHRGCVGEPDRLRTFQRLFEALLADWLAAATVPEAVEGWPAFRERVWQALRLLTDRPGRGRRVAAFTSGGFIGTAVCLVLGAPDRTALELNWRLRNGSLTRLVFSPGRLTLDEFNSVPHLDDPVLWTYR